MLLSLANELKILPTELNRLLIIVVVLSMALTPALAEAGKRFAEASEGDEASGEPSAAHPDFEGLLMWQRQQADGHCGNRGSPNFNAGFLSYTSADSCSRASVGGVGLLDPSSSGGLNAWRSTGSMPLPCSLCPIFMDAAQWCLETWHHLLS